MRQVHKVIKAGGAEAAITSNFDEEKALAREYKRACVDLISELEAAGYVTITPMARTGDYARRLITLSVP